MSDGPTLPVIRAGLETLVAGTDAVPAQLQALVAWVLGRQGGIHGVVLNAVASLASGNRSASDVATIGYAAALGELDPTTRAAMADGLHWLGQRTWFRPQQAPTLESDGVSALGVALAAAAFSWSNGAEWLGHLLLKSAALPSIPPLERSFFLAAAEVLRLPGRPAANALVPLMRVAFARRGIGTLPTQDERRAAWAEALRFSGDSAAEAALALATLDTLTETNLPARLGAAEPGDVVRMLQGVHRSMRRWAWDTRPRSLKSSLARWDVSNEYHVQDMLWAILAPVFPDLADEETLPPVGQKNPRADLTIASLGTIVEVKFLRLGKSFQSIIGEVAEDSSLYRTDPRWTSLVPFVWDDSTRTEEHATLLKGLCALPMVVGAVVVPRPQKMGRHLPTRDEPSALD